MRAELANIDVADARVLALMDHTAQSVILYDEAGRRAIYTDLKDIQKRPYPLALVSPALARAALAVLANVNFTHPMLAKAQAAGVPIATDGHAIGALDDAYNRDYMARAQILFQSHENLPCPVEAWVRQLWKHYGTPIAVVGLGEDGALLAVKNDRAIERIPAVYTRPVVNTIGAGDALFSAFVHTYAETNNPYLAIQ